MEPEINNDLDKKWDQLIKYDVEARAAVQKLEQYGPEAVDKLKVVYSVIGNKTKFSFIADQIASDHRKFDGRPAPESAPDERDKKNDAKGASLARERPPGIFGFSAVLFSVLSLFFLPVFLAPAALILGAVALLKDEKHSEALIIIVIIVLVVVFFNFFKFEM